MDKTIEPSAKYIIALCKYCDREDAFFKTLSEAQIKEYIALDFERDKLRAIEEDDIAHNNA